MSIKSKILYQMLNYGKADLERTVDDYDPKTHTVEKDIVRINKSRRGFHLFSNIVSLMSTPQEHLRKVSIKKGGVPVVTLIPEQPNDQLILYVHGGGFVYPLEKFEKVFATSLAIATQSRICIPEYRLAPEHPFPAGLEDVVAVYKALLDEGYSSAKIIVLGDSAGGNLALALLLKLKEIRMPQPAAVVLLSPFTDINMNSETFITKAESDPTLPVDKNKSLQFTYLRGESPNNPLASPLLGDLSGLPPMMILVGGREILLDDSRLLAQKAQKAGVDVTLDVNEDMFHIYPVYSGILDEAKVAIGKIALFIKMKVE